MRKNAKKILKSILSLLEEAESYEFHKQNLINSLDSLFREYQEGIYSHTEYQKLLDDLLKRKTKKEWIDYYDSYIYFLFKQIEPLLSQIIYFVYNDDSVSKLKLVKEGFVEVKHERIKVPVIEEDKKHELRKIKEKKVKEFVEIKRQPIIGKPPSPLKERFAEEIKGIRKVRGKKVEAGIPERKEKKPSVLLGLSSAFSHYFEKKKLHRKKKHIRKELEKIKKETFSYKLSKLLERLKPKVEKKPKPVTLKKPSFIARILEGLKSKLRRKEKLEFRKLPKKPKKKKIIVAKPGFFLRLKHVFSYARPSPKVHIPELKAKKVKRTFVPKKDRAFEKLVSGLEEIDKGITELKVKEPKISLRMKLDLLMIRLHTGFKHRKVVAKEKVVFKPEEVPVIKAPERVEISMFKGLQKSVSEKLQRIRTFLFVPVEKPKLAEPEKVEFPLEPEKIKLPLEPEKKPVEIPTEKEVSIFATAYKRAAAVVSKAQSRIKSLLVSKPKPLPLKAEKKPVEKPIKEAKPTVKFRFSWESIKESYRKMMEREKKFVAKKGDVTPSMQMHALKEKVIEIEEEEKITPKILKEEVKSIQKIISERKKFKIYQPSFIGSFANATVRKFTFYLIEKYPSFFKTLYDNLRLGNIRVLSNTYVNIMILTTILVSAVSSIFFFTFFLFTNNPFIMLLPKTLVMVVISGSVTFLLFYSYPQMQAKTREKSIDTNLPFAINHISAVSGSGVAPTKMFRLIMESEEYGEIAVDIEKIVEYVELFGYDLLTAVRSVAMTTPSIAFKEFLDGMVSTVESGGDLSVFLKGKASEAMLNYELERQKYTETISTYSDIYTGILIAAPLFFIVALSLVSMLGGTIGGMDVKFIIVIGAYVVIPVLNVLFIIILELTQPEV